MSTTAVLAIVSLAGTACYLLLVAWLHFLPTGLHPVHHPVSAYSTTRYGHVNRIGLLAGGIGILALAAANERNAAAFSETVVLLGVAGICRLLLIVITTDPVDGSRTGRGRLHLLLAIAYFAVLVVAMLNMRLAGQVGTWLGYIAIAATVLLVLASSSRRYFGLIERVLLAATQIWLLLDAAHLVAQSR